jgi:hypothetical protein
MGSKDIITIAGIAATFIVSLVNILYTIAATKKTRFINTITSSRIQWIQLLRQNVSRYAGIAHHWSITPINDQEASRKLIEESDVLRLQIRLQLNPYDKADIKLIALLDEIPKYTDATQFEPMKEAIENLVAETQKRLKEEWERVKTEAKGKF